LASELAANQQSIVESEVRETSMTKPDHNS
jgi:hypothetical protein